MKNIIERIDGFLNEKNDLKMYIIGTTFWVAYDEGSGTAVPLNNKTYFTDKQGDDNFEPLLTKQVLKATKYIKPIKKIGNSSLYELPYYKNGDKNLDIWGGETKPNKMYVLVAVGSINVCTLFKSKNEALAFMK